MPLMIAAAGMSLVSGVLGFRSGRRARRAARRQAEEEARIERQVTGERIRQLYGEERDMAGRTRAIAAGSGIVADRGSPLMVLAEQATEFAREREITRRVGASRAQTALAQGRAVGRQATAQGLTALTSGLAQSLQLFDQRPRN